MTEDYSKEKKRFVELANKSFMSGIYTFTDFLGLGEQSAFFEVQNGIKGIPYTIFGGTDGCERVMIRFGSADLCGYEIEFPISLLRIAPTSPKFAERLTHRDFLGAILNLGINRSVVGDILIRGSCAYVFVKDSIAEFISNELVRVRNTEMTCTITDTLPDGDLYHTEPMKIQASGERIDSTVAKVFSLSRDDAQSLFSKGLIYISGRICDSPSHRLAEGDIVSVRGHGRFIYKGVLGTTKKGKLNILIERYV